MIPTTASILLVFALLFLALLYRLRSKTVVAKIKSVAPSDGNKTQVTVSIAGKDVVFSASNNAKVFTAGADVPVFRTGTQCMYAPALATYGLGTVGITLVAAAGFVMYKAQAQAQMPQSLGQTMPLQLPPPPQQTPQPLQLQPPQPYSPQPYSPLVLQ
jgi:hypothetical protein